MMFIFVRAKLRATALLVIALILVPTLMFAQGLGSSGSVQGQVTDPSGAVIPGATVDVSNPVSGYYQSTQSDDTGHYSISNVPFNNYHLTATRPGFATVAKDINVRSSVPVVNNVSLAIKSSEEVVNDEESSDLVENEP